MAPKVGVFVIHGIGVQESDYADEFVDEMKGRLKNLGVKTGDVKWESAYWANLLNDQEVELWNRVSQSHDLDWVTVRQFFINVFADAIAYQRRPHHPNDMYLEIHKRVHSHLVKLRSALGGVDRPLVIVAHSLGSVIMSNYIWDEQTDKGLGANPFERMETLSGLITFGSNIPLFTLALPKVESIEFPPAALPASLKLKAKWLNFFDGDDVLGYPLRGLSASYQKAVTADIQINVGSLFTSWNPVSHVEYWTDDDFTEPMADLIRDIVSVA